MMENSRTDSEMGMASIFISMEMSMKETGLRTLDTVLVKLSIKIKALIMETGPKVKGKKSLNFIKKFTLFLINLIISDNKLKYRHGEGLFTYLNQDIYSGKWEDGWKQGVGTFIFFETGMKMYGTWKAGKFIQGKWIYPNGTYFEGRYDNNRPKGQGKWNFNNGNVVKGEYSQVITLQNELKLIWRTA